MEYYQLIMIGRSIPLLQLYFNMYVYLTNAHFHYIFSVQVTPAGQSFIQRFRAQTPTVSPTGVCYSATDDDGKFMLWKHNVSGKIICSGLNYAAIPQDGSTMDGLTAYVYDATMFLLQV